MYYIISKAKIVDGDLVYERIGYVTSKENCDYITEPDKIHIAGQWVKNNYKDLVAGVKDATNFEKDTGIASFYVGGYNTTNIDGMGLSEIKDLDNPEGI